MKFLIVLLILSTLLLMSGCVLNTMMRQEISKEDANSVVDNFFRGISKQSPGYSYSILNTYKEDNKWKVVIVGGDAADKKMGIVEVNVLTGKIEYFVYDGKRISFDELMKAS